MVRVAAGIDTATELRVGAAGEPLDAAGVAALASLRASAKRSGAGVGRFGVGFAAVTAVSDAPRVVSRGGGGQIVGVAFDRDRTAVEVEGLGGGVAVELARRGGDAPALRLVWPLGSDEPPLADDVTTEVRLPLRDPEPGRVDALLAGARAQAVDLLLALPWLEAVEVDGDEVRRRDEGGGRFRIGDAVWRVVRAEGAIPPHLLAGLSVEERGRTTWQATWAVREDAPSPAAEPAAAARDVLHAPTPTDEATTLPARLLVTVPLDPDRRHVRSGPVTTHVLRAAAAHYADLVRALPPERRADLVPRPTLPASEVDAVLRDAVLEALATADWVPAAGGRDGGRDTDGGRDLAARRALVLDADPGAAGPLADALADVLADLADPALGASRHAPALAALGVTRLGVAAVCDRLAGVERPPAWWRRLYAALALDTSAVRPGAGDGELAALPVPLADGRTVLGARGTLLPDGLDDRLTDLLAEAGVPGLRLVAPGAAHPLLAALGARGADAEGLLAEPSLLAAVERSVDDAEAGLEVAGLARLVLALVSRAPPGPGPVSRALGALALPDVEGEHRRADELVLPDAVIRPLLGPDSPLGVLDTDLGDYRGPRAALLAVGVLDGFAMLRDEAPLGPDHDLDDEQTWWAEEVERDPEASGGSGGPVPPLVAVRDLDLVDPDRWAIAWPLLAADRDVRAALVGVPGGPRPYTAWWLARHGRISGHPPTAWRLGGAPDRDDGPAGLYDPVPAEAAEGLDATFLVGVGVRTDLVVADAADAADLLARLADPGRLVSPGAALAAHAALVAAVRSGRVDVADVPPPAAVRVADGSVRSAEPPAATGARPPVVVDRPWRGTVLGTDVVPAPGGDARLLADLLDLPTDAERLDGEVRSPGTSTPWVAVPAAVAWAAAAGRELPAGEIVLHDRLRVALVDPEGGPAREVTPTVWDADGTVHADDPVHGLLAAWALDPPGPVRR